VSGAEGDPTQAAAVAVSELAHELRTPLAAIVGFAELLRARDDERLRLEAADQILAGTTRLSRVVDEFVTVFEADPELAARFFDVRARTALGGGK